jgi:hypothetical protein
MIVMPYSLKAKIFRTLAWSFIEVIGHQGMQFVIGILLARLLFPEQFGLIGMLTILIAVAKTFLDSGFGTAVIQKSETTETDICSNIAACVGFIGAANIEFIEHKNAYYFLEINPRFSGGVAYSCIAGYDFVNNHIRCFSSMRIENIAIINRMLISERYEQTITRLYDD